MITNTNFTSGADAAARGNGIGLHIVVPAFDYAKLPERNREQIQKALRSIQSVAVKIMYHSDIAHKSIETELIENNASIEESESNDSLIFSALKQRVGYLWMLSAQGHAVDMGEISRLEAEIAQIRSSARG